MGVVMDVSNNLRMFEERECQTKDGRFVDLGEGGERPLYVLLL